ncbi:unnamed protein product [Camellia sinensis]
MAVSRLLQAKSGLHLQRVGLVSPTRWFCSTSSNNGDAQKSSQSKKPSAAKEQKTVAVESFVKESTGKNGKKQRGGMMGFFVLVGEDGRRDWKGGAYILQLVQLYMETHPGTFPKATQVQNKVGGSWYTLKDILSNLKEKMLGNPLLQNHATNDASDSTVDATVSEVITTHNNKNLRELDEAKNTLMSSKFNQDNISSTAMSCMSSKNMINATASEIVRACCNTDNTDSIELSGPVSIAQSSKSSVDSGDNEKKTTDSTSHISEECSSADSGNLVVFKAIKMHNCPDCIKVAEPACTARLPEAEVVSHDDEKCISTSHIVSEDSSEDLVRSNYTSDSSKMVESENGLMKPQRAVSNKVTSHVTLNESATTRQRNHQPETEMMTSGFRPNSGSEMGSKPPLSFSGTQKISGLADLFMRAMNDRATGEMTGEKNDIVAPNSSEYSNDPTGKGKETSSHIMSLIDCIKDLPREQRNMRSHGNIMSNQTDQTSNKSVIRGVQPEANLRRSDNKERKTSLNGHDIHMETNNFSKSEGDSRTGARFEVFSTNSRSEDGEGSDADIASFDCIKSKPSPQVLCPMSKDDLNKTQNEFLAAKGSDQNKVLVRFLHKDAEKSDIDSIFKDCGCITKIKFHPTRSSLKIACIYFKTKEGMQKALEKSNLIVKNKTVVVEATCSTENMPNRTLIPDLIGDPDVPASLVKNPTQTVMIKELTPDMSSHEIKKALAFCGSNVSGFFFGSSSSTAYMEFGTEEAKERALEKHSINVSGKQLLIFRIDAPRTTVVRMSTQGMEHLKKKIPSMCETYGQVNSVSWRTRGVVDVYFKIAEWPNMLKILNELNGLQMDGSQWIAQPAPVFPADVLHVLWSHPDERRRLKTQIHRLSQKLYPEVGLTSLTNEYYRMIMNE